MKSVFWGSLFCLIFTVVGTAPKAHASNPILTGKELQSGSLMQFDGKNHKALVLIFLSTRCPNSQAHIGEIKKLASANSEFLFLGIHSNADESETEAKEFFKSQALPFKIIQDDQAELADHYKALKTPHAYVISQQGSILYQGGITDSANPSTAKSFFLQDALNDIKTNKPIKTSEGRTLGCVIARTKETQNVW
jgi:peroxiredoxin